MNELIPCPFCGGEAELHTIEGTLLKYAFCGKCNATSGVYDNEEEAIAAWNTRAAVPREMTVREFARQYDRMCESTRCIDCPISSSNNGAYQGCGIWMSTHLSKAVSIVEAWAQEHLEGGKE